MPHDIDTIAVLTCDSCGSSLVDALAEPGPGALWTVDLWCPECEWQVEVVCDEAQADAIQERMEAIAMGLFVALERAEAENMAASAERFAEALRRDLICASDF